MSLLTVEKVTHGFGARQILEDASFRLLKGEHIGLIGANGEGKSTFLNIITDFDLQLYPCTSLPRHSVANAIVEATDAALTPLLVLSPI